MCDVAERLEKMGIAKGIELGRKSKRKPAEWNLFYVCWKRKELWTKRPEKESKKNQM